MVVVIAVAVVVASVMGAVTAIQTALAWITVLFQLVLLPPATELQKLQ